MRKLLLAYNSWIILLLLLIPSLIGVLHPGFFTSDDGNWMVIRFSAFYEALRHGEFPVRFLPRLLNGYGYPVSDFLYPLFMYLGVPIHIVGVNFVNTIKVIFGLSLIGSGIFTFLWLRKLFTSGPAMVGALAFVYFPYHVFDLYSRGSIGEVLALCVTPFIFWQIEKKNIPFISLGIALLILAHNSLALMILPIILIYYYLQQKNIKNIGIALLLGLGFSAFFWFPALFDKQYTVFDRTAVSRFDEYFLGLSNWYIAGSISLLAFILGVIGVLKKSKLVIFFEIILVCSLILALPISHIIWRILPLEKYVQFPFRFLSLAIIASSYLITNGVSLIKRKYRLAVLLISALVIIVSVFPVLLPTKYQYYPDTWYSTNQDSTTVQNEYLPLWVNTVPTNKTQSAQIIKGEGSITTQQQNSSKILVQASITKDSVLQLNTIYFPGWNVKIDGRSTSLVYADTYGVMQLALIPGTHIITASFGETPLRLVADIVSLICLLSIAGIALLQYKRK